MEEKNKRKKNTDLDQFQAQGEGICDTFVQLSMHLQAISGVY